MHFPLVFSLGQFRIPAHLVFELLAYAIAYQIYRREAISGKDYYNSRMRLKLTLWTLLGAFVGSRLIAVMEDFSSMPGTAFGIVIAFFGSKSILGAFAGGLFATEIAKHFWHQRRSTGDKLVIPILVGLVIGRIGCFLGGLEDRTQGSVTAVPWSIDYGDGLTRHPLPLYEIIFCLVVLVLFTAFRISWRHGGRFQVFLAAYFAYRFCAEFLKDRVFLVGIFSGIQCVALLGVLYYAYLWRKRLPIRIGEK